MKKHEVVIIGAGVAGISAAKTLLSKKPNIDIKIVSNDIGGRVVSSKDGSVQYGAYFVNNNYKNAFNIIKKGKRLRVFNLSLYGENQDATTGYKVFLHPIQIFRLYILIVKFNKNYKEFKYNSELHGQKKALESNKFLLNLFKENAEDFARNHGFDSLAKNYISYWMGAISFTTLNKISAFDLVRFSAGVFSGYYRYSFNPSTFKEEWGDKYIEDSVTKINNIVNGYYKIEAKNNILFAENVIVATPPDVTKKLLGLERVKHPVDAYMFHVNGSLIKKWQTRADFLVFHANSDVISISKEENGSYLLYSRVPNPLLDEYFESPDVIATKHWSPAFNLVVDDTIIDQKIDRDMYLAGDFNITGIEDAYITGIYAANSILSKN